MKREYYDRYIKKTVKEDLKAKMVFVGGPRQVGKTTFAVDCKTGEKDINPFLYYFRERTRIPEFYQVHTGGKDYIRKGIRVLPVETFCKELDLI